MTEKFEAHFHGTIQGLVIGDNNTVTLIYPDGEQRAVPFLAPPKPRFELVGRDNILNSLLQKTISSDIQGSQVIYGLPGVGKTSLALRLAHERAIIEHFADGILWAGLGQNPNLLLILGVWCVALGISVSEVSSLGTPEERSKAIHEAIGSKHMLLIVDDVWEKQVALTYYVGGPNCSHIFTTRLPEVTTIANPKDVITLHELDEDKSIFLLQKLAPGVVSDNHETRELVKLVGGLPLGLVLIGNYLRTKSLANQERRLRATLDELRNPETILKLREYLSPAESHPSLRPGEPLSLDTIISISFYGLDHAAQNALQSLAIIPPKPNSFSEEGALYIINEPFSILDNLVDSGLLESAGKDRYTIHQTISESARSRLIHGERTYKRMINYYIQYASDNQENLDALELEITNIIAALNKAQELGEYSSFLKGVIATSSFFQVRGLLLVSNHYLKVAEKIARDTDDTKSLIPILLSLGHISEKQGLVLDAENYLLEAFKHSMSNNDVENASNILRLLGWVYGSQCMYKKAVEKFSDGLSICKEYGLAELEGKMLHGLGWAYMEQGNYHEAEIYLLQGLEISRKFKVHLMSIHDLSMLYVKIGEYSKAEFYVNEGLETARKLQYEEHVARQLWVMADICIIKGELDRAESLLAESLTICRNIGLSNISRVLRVLGQVKYYKGQYSEAKSLTEEAILSARKSERKRYEAEGISLLIEIYLKEGLVGEADKILNEGLAITEYLNNPEIKIDMILMKSKLLSLTSKENVDLEISQTCLRLAQEIERKDLMSMSYLEIGKSHMRQEKYPEALQAYKNGLRLAKLIQNRWPIAHFLIQTGDTLVHSNEMKSAKRIFTEALNVASQLEARELIAHSKFGLARILLSNNQRKKAKILLLESLNILNEIGHTDAKQVHIWLTQLSKT